MHEYETELTIVTEHVFHNVFLSLITLYCYCYTLLDILQYMEISCSEWFMVISPENLEYHACCLMMSTESTK